MAEAKRSMVLDMSLLKLIAGHGSAMAIPLVAMYSLFTPIADHNALAAKSDRGYIMDLVEKARAEPPGGFKDSMCRSLHEAIAELCAAAPSDAICVDRAMWSQRAGC